MAMFKDTWLADFTQWELFTAGGGCACCIVPQQKHSNMKLETYAKQCVDVDLVAVLAEIEASNWQPFMLEETWRDRVLFRRLLSNRASRTLVPAWSRSREPLVAFWGELGDEAKQDCLRLPVGEVTADLEDTFEGTYGTLMGGLVRQLENFHQTGYGCDAAGTSDPGEAAFENALLWEGDGSAAVIRVALAYADGPQGFLAHLEHIVSDPSTIVSPRACDESAFGLVGCCSCPWCCVTACWWMGPLWGFRRCLVPCRISYVAFVMPHARVVH
jgi:hypothetical protein